MGWDALTSDQVARSARASRACVRVFPRSKESRLFAIGRARPLLPPAPIIPCRARIPPCSAGVRDRVEAIERAYCCIAIIPSFIVNFSFRGSQALPASVVRCQNENE